MFRLTASMMLMPTMASTLVAYALMLFRSCRLRSANALRTHDQDGDQEQERDRVTIKHVTDEDGAERLNQAQHQARDQRPPETTEAAQHDDGQRLVADDEAHGGLDEIVQKPDQRATERGERRANGE